MKHVVFLSGGAGSYIAAKRVIEKHGKDDVILLFQDVLIEDEDLYTFLSQVESFLGIPITRIAEGRTPWEVYVQQRMLGNAFQDPCSRILKRETALRWIKERFSPDECRLYVGIDMWEQHRITAIENRWKPYMISSPLLEKPYLMKADMRKIIREDGLIDQRLYQMGFEHSNCGGWCIKAGMNQFALLLEKWPERYAEFEKKEQEVIDALGKKVTVMADRRKDNGKNGQKVPITLKEFRERKEQASKGVMRIEFEDYCNNIGQEGCACMAV